MRRTSSGRSIFLTQVKMDDAPKLLKIPKSECPDIWIRLPRHKWPESWSSIEDPVVPLERNLYGHLLAGLLWEMPFGKIQLQHGWEKVSNWECLSVHRQKRIILICVCGCHKITEPCLNREFQRAEQKSFHSLRIFVFLRGLMSWRVMKRNVWNENVS